MEKLDLQRQRVNDWMREQGACFAVVRQGQRQITRRPFDPIPRVLSAKTLPIWNRG